MMGKFLLTTMRQKGRFAVSACQHKHAWRLIDRIDGAKSSAIIYSITETAKTNHLNPFRYLPHFLTVLKDYQDDTDYSFIKELLTWLERLPENCRSKSGTTMRKSGRRKRRSKNKSVLMICYIRNSVVKTAETQGACLAKISRFIYNDGSYGMKLFSMSRQNKA